jgi:hypothetical protein
MGASLRGSMGTGTTEDESSTGRLGCWISPRFGPFSLGVRFETYEPFISLIVQILFWAVGNCGYGGSPCSQLHKYSLLVEVTEELVSYHTQNSNAKKLTQWLYNICLLLILWHASVI